jgi:hypothetical protein
MGLAFDTISGHVTNNVALTPVTPSTGDSFTIRNFPDSASAHIQSLLVKQATLGTVQVRSPLMHDNTRGIQFKPGAAGPASFLVPAELSQDVYSGDTLTASLTCGAADSSRLAIPIYYTDARGTSARLASWGDIKGNIKSIKPVEVISGASVIASWVDTLLTATEDLLHVKSDYAVVGYVTSVAVLACGIKGQETGNLRVCGPGTTDALDTSDWFIRQAEGEGLPMIPVFNGENKGSINVTVADNAAGTAPSVQLILAELTSPFSG